MSILLVGIGGVLLLVAGPASATPRTTHCTPYIVRYKRTYGGHRYAYRIRIHDIAATRISCPASRKLIHRADNTLTAEPGVYQSVPPWRCRSFRPFGGGPHGEFMWYSDCKRRRAGNRGGGRLSWTETQQSVRRIS
jgi:hypothetical protein